MPGTITKQQLHHAIQDLTKTLESYADKYTEEISGAELKRDLRETDPEDFAQSARNALPVLFDSIDRIEHKGKLTGTIQWSSVANTREVLTEKLMKKYDTDRSGTLSDKEIEKMSDMGKALVKHAEYLCKPGNSDGSGYQSL